MLSALSLVLLGMASVGWVVSLWDLVALNRVRRRPLIDPPRWPSFSILKPIAGLDDDLLENLQSHLSFEYPGEWELLIGICSDADPAYPIAKSFADAHPQRVKLLLQEGEP